MAPFFLYIFLYCITIKGIYERMNSLIKRLFAGNSPRFSFLTVSLYGSKKKVRRSPRCDFLTVSLYDTMRTINITYFLPFKTERSHFLMGSTMCLRTVSAACIFTSDNCHLSNF